ncbi:MAG TPA: ATP-binding protein [Candidatus Onthenecus intestinigallinarum]|uniref:ATP-binding protein n=1 Tax=Candidatus Onthenecus intestinigallinarum TaxID=2840875 RepID=A0A9D1CPU2_9FIRM|nr:ATP-binding protein [Candidatus Onthenecus intestinigallinarum]
MADVSILETFDVERGAFETAGEASATIKRTLKRLGVDAGILRRVAVATYEVELNLIIHSLGGRLELAVDENWVRVTSSDRGPGIPDIDKAMTEGYSTAPEDVRTLGFGAGMGLPNMKRNADDFSIASEVGVGTTICMGFKLR